MLTVIVLKKELFNLVKKELQYIGILFVVALVMFKVVFFKENLIVIFRVVLSLFWLFILPGYFLMLYWKEKLEFIERFIIGIALSLAVVGTLSYYLGLFGLHIKFQTIILPLVLIAAGIWINMRK